MVGQLWPGPGCTLVLTLGLQHIYLLSTGPIGRPRAAAAAACLGLHIACACAKLDCWAVALGWAGLRGGQRHGGEKAKECVPICHASQRGFQAACPLPAVDEICCRWGPPSSACPHLLKPATHRLVVCCAFDTPGCKTAAGPICPGPLQRTAALGPVCTPIVYGTL